MPPPGKAAAAKAAADALQAEMSAISALCPPLGNYPATVGQAMRLLDPEKVGVQGQGQSLGHSWAVHEAAGP